MACNSICETCGHNRNGFCDIPANVPAWFRNAVKKVFEEKFFHDMEQELDFVESCGFFTKREV